MQDCLFLFFQTGECRAGGQSSQHSQTGRQAYGEFHYTDKCICVKQRVFVLLHFGNLKEINVSPALIVLQREHNEFLLTDFTDKESRYNIFNL